MLKAMLNCLLATVASIAVLLFLVSEQGRKIPANPLARLLDRETSYSIATRTDRLSSGQPTASAEARGSPDVERALAPLREAMAKPGPSIDRINALIALNAILGSYAAKNRFYPDSKMEFVSAAKALAILNDPEFAKNVPASIIDEIQYVSDGKSYKLIIVGSGDCAVVRSLRPAMVDPKRSAGDLDCIAYGVWTPQGRDF